MLIISQNARLAHLPMPHDAVFRVNAAWVKSREELFALLKGIRNDVFLDFPEGRKKPPTPVLKFDDLLDAMKTHKVVKYFAVTNVKDSGVIKHMRTIIPKGIQIVPKIESLAGVANLEEILESLPYRRRHIMLDKEDLYTDLNSDNGRFEECIQSVREKCRKNRTGVLELAGVIFQTHEE